LHPSGRCNISSGRSTVKASSIRTTRTFCLDLPLCREASNCSRLHPSGRLSNTVGCLSLFDKENDFVPKHRYGKIAATVRTLSLIRQVVHTKFKLSGRQSPWSGRASLNMEVVCRRSSTVWTSVSMVWTLKP